MECEFYLTARSLAVCVCVHVYVCMSEIVKPFETSSVNGRFTLVVIAFRIL